jgi:hypothetical protein
MRWLPIPYVGRTGGGRMGEKTGREGRRPMAVLKKTVVTDGGHGQRKEGAVGGDRRRS